MIPSIENIDWHSFLSRPPLPHPDAELLRSIVRHPVLITGAGGSIGSALALRLAQCGAALALLEASESSLYDLQREFENAGVDCPAAFYLGSTTDSALLDEIFSTHNPHLAFHAAAFKHVPLLEAQPLAAITNNIFGTEALANCASSHMAQVILLSTDKAVAPVSVLGATKHVAEQIVLATGGTVVRLGNVLASRGSVAELFAHQLAAQMPLTVTDPAARRYFLTISEAVDLLVSSAGAPNRATLFVPYLPSTHFIVDLARLMAKTLAPGRDIAIEFTNLRPGDKETEKLWSAHESPQEHTATGLLRLVSGALPSSELQNLLDELRSATAARDIPAAIHTLRKLVLDYTPGATVIPTAMADHE